MVARSTLCAQRLQVALGHFFHRAPITQFTQFIFPPGFPVKLGRRQQNRCPPQQRETRRLVLQESVANSVGSPGKMARDSCGWGMDLKVVGLTSNLGDLWIAVAVPAQFFQRFKINEGFGDQSNSACQHAKHVRKRPPRGFMNSFIVEGPQRHDNSNIFKP